MSHSPTPTRRTEADGHLRYLLTAYLFENLSAEGRQEVETHLAACESCREEFNRLKKTLGLATEALKLDSVEYQFDTRRRERVMATAEEAMQRRSSQRIGVAKTSAARKSVPTATNAERKGAASSFSLTRTLLVVVPLLLVLSVLSLPLMMSERKRAYLAVNKIGNAVESATTKGLADGGFDASGNLSDDAVTTELYIPKGAVLEPSPKPEAKTLASSEDSYRRVAPNAPGLAPDNSGGFVYTPKPSQPITLKSEFKSTQDLPTNGEGRFIAGNTPGGGGVGGTMLDDLVGQSGAGSPGSGSGWGAGNGRGTESESGAAGRSRYGKAKVPEGQAQQGQSQTQGVSSAAKEIAPRPRIRYSGGGCFPAGTRVKTESGFQAIETIQPGTQVHACNPQTGVWSLKPVTQILTHEYAGDLITLQSGSTVFEATGNHPVWVCSGEHLAARPRVKDLRDETQAVTSQGRWVEARDLREGDQLSTTSGRVNLNVLKTQETHQTVFNLTVENEHTYAVSELGILVHNKEEAMRPEEETVATSPNAKNMSTIEVPPDVLARAELKDHFESINPDRPDTKSAFGNPDAHLFKKESPAFEHEEEVERKLALLADGKPNADDWSKLPPKQDSGAAAWARPKTTFSREPTPATPMPPVTVAPPPAGTTTPTAKSEPVPGADGPDQSKVVAAGKWMFAEPKNAFGFDRNDGTEAEGEKVAGVKLGDNNNNIPHAEYVIYPDNWKEIAQRSSETARGKTTQEHDFPGPVIEPEKLAQLKAQNEKLNEQNQPMSIKRGDFKGLEGFKAERAKDANGPFADSKELYFVEGESNPEIKKLKEAFKSRQTELELRQRKLQERQDSIRAKGQTANPKDLALFREVQETQAEEAKLNADLDLFTRDVDQKIVDEESIAFLGRLKAQETASTNRLNETEIHKARIQKLEESADDLNKRGDFKNAEALAQRILILDPLNKTAEEIKRTARRGDRGKAGTTDGTGKDYAWSKVEEAHIPYGDLLAAPKDWDRIEKRTDVAQSETLLRGFDFARTSMPELRFQDYVAHPQAVPPAERVDWGLDEDAFIEQKGYRPFVDCARDHLSTFGMDVSTASYTRTRGLLQAGRLPEPEEVRTEEFINYFKDFGLGQSVPAGDTFAVWAECAPEALNAPSSNLPSATDALHTPTGRVELLKVAIASREPRADERKPAVLTLVVDVSGSMRQAQGTAQVSDRLALVRDALKDLVGNLQPEDSVCIVAFHEQASLALPRTQARQKQRILEAIDALTPHGGTNVEAGLQLGYRMAEEAFSSDGVNRVLLCSDGVANTGARGPDELKNLVKTFAGRGIDLNAIGFGLGQYNDKMLEQLAQTGNGACFFVDQLAEAKKVFKEQLPPNLNVLARDAKVQVEFNPERVERYRLLGYEKRKIKDEDFRNDKIDGGEVAHQTRVTALYELLLKEGQHGSLGKVFLRWKDAGLKHLPVIERNYPLEESIRGSEPSPELRLLNCVAAFAELLNQNPHRRESSFSRIQEELERLPAELQAHPKVAEFYYLLGAARKAWVAQSIQNLKNSQSK